MFIQISSFQLSSLWPSGIGSRLGRNRLWVRFLAVSDIYLMFIEPTITWFPSIIIIMFGFDFLGPFGVLWVHMAWHKKLMQNALWSENHCMHTAWMGDVFKRPLVGFVQNLWKVMKLVLQYWYCIGAWLQIYSFSWQAFLCFVWGRGGRSNFYLDYLSGSVYMTCSIEL